MWHSDQIDKLAGDFVAMQADLTPVDKTANNTFFNSKYAPLPHIVEALKPVLSKHNFSLSCLPAIVDGPGGLTNGLRFVLLHKTGQWLSGEWMLNPVQRTPQAEGADSTYKRRFGLQSITGLVADDDDDGNVASRPAVKQEVKATRKSEADVQRDKLRKLAESRGWDLERVAAAYSQSVTVDGRPGVLKTASVTDVEAFMSGLEAGLVKI